MKPLTQDLLNKATIWLQPRLQNALPAFVFPQQERRFQAYCIGAPKTGTTSLALLFQPQFRSAHEAEASLVLAKLLDYTQGRQDRDRLIQYLKHRDRRLALEMDSSHLYYPFFEVLAQTFPEAKFILTIRDCYSWLDSLLNHHAALYKARGQQPRFHRTKWIRYYDEIFGAQRFRHAPAEQILADHHLYTLDGFFHYWAQHNQSAIAAIPPERLLVIRTQDIDQSVEVLERFLGLPPGLLPTPVRGNTRDQRQKRHLLRQIEPSFLEAKAHQHCHALMAQYFPAVQPASILARGKS